MSVSAYITRIKNVKPHPNADRLKIAECFGNPVIVGLDTQEEDLGIYFPTDSKVGLEYANENKLIRTKDENGNHLYGYLEEDKRHISTLKLRGACSDGLFMQIKSLEKFCDISQLKEGEMITTLKGILICEKYIPRGKNRAQTQGKSKNNKIKEPKESFPYFAEHIDTSQLVYNLHRFKQDDWCYITLKMHGTSGRVSHAIKETKIRLPKLIYKSLKFFGINLKPKKSWDYVSGSRRVVLKNFDGGFYGNDDFRLKWHKFFEGKLHKGESVYFEIVGYTHDAQLIMPECNNEKTKDKEFIKQFGKTTQFTYGCDIGQNDIYVYRMTMTNDDGYVVEMPWHLVRYRCEQMRVKHVPELDKFLYTNEEDLMNRVNKYIDGADPIGKTHIREGIVIRIENREKISVFKHKSFNFKVLEGIVKADDVLDMEEAENEEVLV